MKGPANPWEWVVLSIFARAAEAELAGTKLQSAGIPFTITKDDAGGMRPELAMSGGVRIFVPSILVKRARRPLAGDG